MKQLSDVDFLIWLSQRMRFKYGDHIEISNRLEKIAAEIKRRLETLEEISKKDYSEVECLFK